MDNNKIFIGNSFLCIFRRLPGNSTLYGMYVEKCEVSATYPVGRKYIRKPIPNNRQSLWRDYMYVLPFPDNQANTMKNFVNNPKWQ